MNKIRIAAIADTHIGKNEIDFSETFKEISEQADILALCGDLTDRGQPEEMKMLVLQLNNCSIPVVAVFGNHDYESGKEKEIKIIFKDAGHTILDGESTVIKSVGFAGIKGFAGGFDSFTLAAWGEKTIKDFVQESVNESLKLEKALSDLSTEKKVVLMHYSPIAQTVEGEPKELYPFLGCSRLVNPIDRDNVSFVLHGHAHHGVYEGKTQQGIPVYNVSLSILQKNKGKKNYTILEI
jgi:Icc-related predicted phosphoesterase